MSVLVGKVGTVVEFHEQVLHAGHVVLLVDRPEQTAFKGMELYSWQGDDGQWLFSILVGTNRNKTLAEIRADPIDLTEVKRQFCLLAKGEQVFWMADVRGETGEATPFPPVPADLVAELQAQAETCEIVLYR